tara:strand:- start:332 stop:862 length:531 start_codon:yes stop_codon:yes gene_type:complete
MNSQFAYEIHQLMESGDVRLSFSGEFSPDLITVLLLMAESNIGDKSVMKKVYNVMIECLENLTKHSLKVEGDQFPAMFILGKDDDYYYLATGNKIASNEVQELEEKLIRVNSSDKKDLIFWHNEILTSETSISSKGGAGLGIIDMALKSGNKFEYSFDKIDDFNYFFTLKIKVDQE